MLELFQSKRVIVYVSSQSGISTNIGLASGFLVYYGELKSIDEHFIMLTNANLSVSSQSGGMMGMNFNVSLAVKELKTQLYKLNTCMISRSHIISISESNEPI